MEYLLILARIKRVFEFHFCSLKEDFRRDLRQLRRERCGHRDR